jgi:anti-anti-sigma regulatory factor
MDRNTRLEALSIEIFSEIFDYLHALDIFTAFSSLNRRILSILQIIPLRVVISHNHLRYHVDYLSSHLISHAHQVISVDIYDTIHDDSSIVNLLFSQHKFINLQSCIFTLIHPSTR